MVDSLSHDTLRDSVLILVTNFFGKKPYTQKVPAAMLLSANIILRQISVENKSFLDSEKNHPTCL